MLVTVSKPMSSTTATEQKARAFVEHYIVHFNGQRAVEECGAFDSTGQSAANQAWRLLKRDDVQQWIGEAIEARSKRMEVTQDSALTAQRQLAFWDARDYIKVESNRIVAKGIEELTSEQASAISKVKVTQQDTILRGAGPGEPGEIVQLTRIEYELDNKHGALESLFRHLGLYKDKLEVSHTFGTVQVPAQADASEWADIVSEQIEHVNGSRSGDKSTSHMEGE